MSSKLTSIWFGNVHPSREIELMPIVIDAVMYGASSIEICDDWNRGENTDTVEFL